MNFLRFTCFLSALLLFLTFSASAADTEDYFPLKNGDEWVMDVTLKSAAGVQNTITFKITGLLEQDGKKYLKQHLTVASQPPHEDDILLRKDETGFYSRDGTGPNGKEQVDVQLPFVAGKSWPKSFRTKAATETEVGIETITLGSVTYEKCYHLRIDTSDGERHADYWYAPNIGMIKAVFSNKDEETGSITLREFKPGKE